MICPFCKEEIIEGALLCKHCKSQLVADNAEMKTVTQNIEQTKSKTTAAVLTFFLGGLGIHKFYTGNWGWGIIYLIFCFTYIPGIVALVEFIRYLILDKEEFAQKAANTKTPFGFIW